MARRFHLTRSASPRPPSAATVFCDGSADETWREGVDLELSHWVPNRTPARYRADTSTEICLRYLAEPLEREFDLVVNNHVDVDGMLSVFTLVHPDVALGHAAVLAGAAATGDFDAWAEEPAQALYQELTLRMQQLEGARTDPQAVYAACFDRALDLLAGRAIPAPGVAEGVAALARAVDRVEAGEVRRVPRHEHFVRFEVPAALAGGDLAAALRVPGFNEPLDLRAPLPAPARNRHDRDAVHLVSVESAAQGWHHDLFYPGHYWADTERRWRPPGLVAAGTNSWRLELPALLEAVRELQAAERHAGTWCAVGRLTLDSGVPGRGGGVVLSFLLGGAPAPSSLAPAQVGECLAPVFAEEDARGGA